MTAGQALSEQLSRNIELRRTESEIERQVLENKFKYLDTVKQINETAAAGQKTALLQKASEEQRLANLEAIKDFSDGALGGALDLVTATETQLEADERRRELIAEGINPALADSLVNIEQQFDAERNQLKALEGVLTAELARVDVNSDIAKALQDQLDKIKEIQGELDKAEGDKKESAEANAAPGKLESYMNQLQADLNDTEGMIVSLAGTVESEISSAMGSAITSLINGTGSAQKAFEDMFKNIGKAFIDMAVKMIAKALIMKALGILGSGGGGGGFTSAAASPGGSAGVAGIGGGMANPFSFAGGGYTGNAPRSGGVDGRGGFPAILHGNETVIDHTQAMNRYSAGNSSAPINYSPNIQATTMPDGQQYVTVEQMNVAVRNGMTTATRDGAKQGQARTLATLKNSRSQRAKLGM